MSQLIYCKFLDSDEKPRGRNYTYEASGEVKEGDYVEVEVTRPSCDGDNINSQKVLVTKTNITPEEIPGYASFKDKIKRIKGLCQQETNE